MIYWMRALVDLAEVTSSGRLRRQLHWAIHAWRLLDRVEFGRAHPCFTLAVWFQRERFEALLAVNIMGHVLVPWCWRRRSCQSRSEASNGGSNLSRDEELAWCFMTWSSGMYVGATTYVKSEVLPFRMKIQGLALIGCA